MEGTRQCRQCRLHGRSSRAPDDVVVHDAFGAPWYFSDDDAVADFKKYKDPGAPGAQMQNILDVWLIHGIHRHAGNNDTGPEIAASIEDFRLLLMGDTATLKLQEQIRLSIWLFVGCYIGFVMPKFVPVPLDPDDPVGPDSRTNTGAWCRRAHAIGQRRRGNAF
jgi:hypothetical protein